MKKSKSYRELQFENEHVCVWKTIISPDHPLETERHDAAKIIVGLKDGAHKAYWVNGNEYHPLNEQVEVMVIEMKKPKDRPLPSIPID